MPIINGTFGYSSVVDTMKKVAIANKLTIPDAFIFVDVRYKNSIIIHSLIICTSDALIFALSAIIFTFSIQYQLF